MLSPDFFGGESMNHKLLTKSTPCKKSTSSHVICLLKRKIHIPTLQANVEVSSKYVALETVFVNIF